jgi:hypothetical protein
MGFGIARITLRTSGTAAASAAGTPGVDRLARTWLPPVPAFRSILDTTLTVATDVYCGP